MRRAKALLSLVISTGFLAGCSGLTDYHHSGNSNTGGNTGGNPGGSGGGTTSVVVAPASASRVTFGTQNFAATVSGTSNTAVTWMVNGVAGGNATTGTISATGVYNSPPSVAPTTTPRNNPPATVAVMAVPQATSTATGSATVTLIPQEQAAQTSAIKLG